LNDPWRAEGYLSDNYSQFRSAIAPRYRVERELGRGGMAIVFLAKDLRHDRPVALKVLHSERASGSGTDRFVREVALAARLQHPNILTVLDSGQAADLLWYTMPLVDGESLRDRLRRETQLPLEAALRITLDAARALEYAHRHGVVHRDIKPENLLLTSDGSTLVADFGVARALTPNGEQLTQTGLAIGTVAYMSPEQTTGDRSLDGRSDQYSLGCVLYEMLAGQPPFTGPTAQAIAARRLRGEIPGLRKVRPNVPPAVESALLRSLSTVPADRFATMAAFAEALQSAGTGSSARAAATRRRGVLVGLGVILCVALFAWWHGHHRSDAGAAAAAKRIAVLPFDSQSDSADAYFAEGVADEVRSKLSRVAGIAIIARSSSNQYRHSSKAPQEIARELAAQYLLTGVVRWDRRPDGLSLVKVTPELLRIEHGSTPTTAWQQDIEATVTDVFKVQADIAERVAAALDVELGPPERNSLAERPARSLPAYEAFLKGEQVSQSMSVWDPETLRRSIGYYAQAVRLDSMFSAAWAQLSRAHSALFSVGTPSTTDAGPARAEAERALALRPDRADGHLALGFYYRVVGHDFARALAEFTEGLRIAPGNPDLLRESGFVLEGLGRWDEGVHQFEEARVRDPRSAATWLALAEGLLWLRRYREAGQASDSGLVLAPSNLLLTQYRAMASLGQGDLPAARGALDSALHDVDTLSLVAYTSTAWDLGWMLRPHQSALLLQSSAQAFDDDQGAWAIALAQAYWLQGDSAKMRAYADTARSAFEQVTRRTPGSAQAHANLGIALSLLGRKRKALDEGRRSVALVPVDRDAYMGPYYQHQLARIYMLAGERGMAVKLLESVLRMPYYLSPAWLSIDPSFGPLRTFPAFQRLIQGR
jgi:eukaryotic-like serine/threonine-protein kinase